MKIYNEAFDETYYYEKLQNGLDVYIFHRPAFQTTSAAFGTPYGALNVHQKVNDEVINFHPGIAHFLEHKLFESEEGDILNIFTKYGANVNAFTSYHQTVYHFQMAGDQIEKPLNLLLDFVQDLSITEESVELEKDIINQELKMYQQMPDVRLLNTCFEKMYHHYPLKYDVGGSEETVYATTKEELERCYKLNYHPSNMILVITTYLDPEYLLTIIKENQAQKAIEPITLPLNANPIEPKEVVEQEYSFHMDVSKAKHIYGIKIEPNFKDLNDLILQEWCMRILLEAHFTQLNPDYQKWLDDEEINDFFGFEVDYDHEAAYILFYYEKDEKSAHALKTFIDEELKKDRLNEASITQLKRRFLGIAYATFNDLDGFNTSFIRDRLSGFDIFDFINIIQNIDLKTVLEVYEKTSFENYNLVSLLPNELK